MCRSVNSTLNPQLNIQSVALTVCPRECDNLKHDYVGEFIFGIFALYGQIGSEEWDVIRRSEMSDIVSNTKRS